MVRKYADDIDAVFFRKKDQYRNLLKKTRYRKTNTERNKTFTTQKTRKHIHASTYMYIYEYVHVYADEYDCTLMCIHAYIMCVLNVLLKNEWNNISLN